MNEIVSPVQAISYTDRDFTSVYTELLDLVKELTAKWDPSISNESDPGVILLKLNAIIADKCNYAIDKSLLECFPLSVTQEQNARQLYEQLGYYMHWYRSATVDVYLKWISEAVDTNIVIPKFTMICDSSNNTVYSLIGYTSNIDGVDDIKLNLADTVGVTVKAIQGTAISYEINGDTLITSANLDYNNRLYFPVTNVAENGIFITNVGQNNYSVWKRKDNLLIENLGNTYYRFGIVNNGAACYIEFPEDAETILGEGINITYIKTDGEDGNVSSKQLDRLYNMNVAVGEDSQGISTGVSYNLNTDTLLISNFAASKGGKNYESINEAYQSYKRTVGTFDTLVTLRDYINYINNSELVSNCFVCDRNNDIQTSYKVLSSINSIDQLVNVVEQVEDNGVTHDAMTAYDIKLYLLQYVDQIDANTSKYLSTFNMLNNSERRLIEGYIEDNKSLNHNIGDILPPSDTSAHVCYFKNKCPVSFTIITQSSLTPTQIIDLRTNIVSAIYKMFNSRNLEFGEKISYELLFNTILTSDTRIKNVSLDNLTYQTFAVYYDNNRKLTYDGTQWLDNDWNVVNPLDYNINPPSGAVSGATIILPDEFVEVALDSDDFLTVISSNKSLSISLDNDPTKLQAFIDDLAADGFDTYHPIELTYTSGVWKDSNDYTITLSTYGISLTGSPSNGDKLRIRVSYAYQVKNDIYAKSVLAGTTQLFIKDETFDYRLQGRYAELQSNIEKLESNVNITFTSANDTYLLRDGEALQFYTPNLVNSDSYQKYTKFEYYITQAVNANSSYQLSDGEFIIFYWKANEDDVYQYHSYGTGTIFSPNFDLPKVSGTVSVVGEELLKTEGASYVETSTGLDGEMSLELDGNIKNITNPENILSGTRAITIQKLNTFTLDRSSGVGMYWILNSKTDNNRYVLFDQGESTRILAADEYFIFSNGSYTSYTTLGAGTTITRSTTSGTWQVDVVETTDITNYGLVALTEHWFTIPDNESVDLIENKFTTLGQGCTVRIRTENQTLGTNYTLMFNHDGYTITISGSPAPSTISLSDFNIEYLLPDATSYARLDTLTLSDDASLNAKSLLAIRLSPDAYQILLDGQSISYYFKDDATEHVFTGYDFSDANNWYPTALMSSFSVIGSGDAPVYTSTIPIENMFSDNPEVEYLSIYNQHKSGDITTAETSPRNLVTFNDDGTVVCNFYTSGSVLTASLSINLPVGEYILPIQNNNDSTSMTSCVVKLGTTTLHKMNSVATELKDNGIHYIYLPIDSTTTKTLNVVVTGITTDISLKLLNIYKYHAPEGMDSTTYAELNAEIKRLDVNSMFKYDNEIDESKLIANPLDPLQFFNVNHIYNNYTIPVISAISIA